MGGVFWSYDLSLVGRMFGDELYAFFSFSFMNVL